MITCLLVGIWMLRRNLSLSSLCYTWLCKSDEPMNQEVWQTLLLWQHSELNQDPAQEKKIYTVSSYSLTTALLFYPQSMPWSSCQLVQHWFTSAKGHGLLSCFYKLLGHAIFHTTEITGSQVHFGGTFYASASLCTRTSSSVNQNQSSASSVNQT